MVLHPNTLPFIILVIFVSKWTNLEIICNNSIPSLHDYTRCHKHHTQSLPRENLRKSLKIDHAHFYLTQKVKNYEISILSTHVMWDIKIGVFDAAESIPVLSFTPKCKVLDL